MCQSYEDDGGAGFGVDIHPADAARDGLAAVHRPGRLRLADVAALLERGVEPAALEVARLAERPVIVDAQQPVVVPPVALQLQCDFFQGDMSSATN